MEYSVFRESISESQLLASVAPIIAWGLPWIEFIVSLLLIIPRWRLKGLYASLLLMIAFTGYIIGILLFAKNLPCSCGGIIQQLSWPQHLVFNSVFLLMALLGLRLQRREKKAYGTNLSISKYQISGQ